MPTLEVTASDFDPPYAALNAAHTIQVSKRKALKFATTVGTALYTTAFGRTQTAVALAAYRAQAVRCVIDFTRPKLTKYKAYKELDGTEKSSLSYWIGMTVAGIVADELLKVPRLAHASKHKGVIKVDPTSMSLADLVGQDAPGAWHVIEAKGRQTATQPPDEKKYKDQAETIGSVGGIPVTTTSYSVAFLRRTITAKLVDPPPKPGSIDLQMNPDDLGAGYYKPYIDFLGQGLFKVARGQRTFLVRPVSYDPIDHEYVYVGLEDRFYFGEVNETVAPIDDPQMYVGSDGVVIITSDTPCNV